MFDTQVKDFINAALQGFSANRLNKETPLNPPYLNGAGKINYNFKLQLVHSDNRKTRRKKNKWHLFAQIASSL